MDKTEAHYLDPVLLAQTFSKAAKTYNAVAHLQQEVCERTFERLEFTTIKPELIVDVGCGTGFASKLLKAKYKKAKLISIDLAEGMLQQARKQFSWWKKPKFICADAAHLPLASNSVDLLFSSLMLHWSNDIAAVVKEWSRVLKPNGLLMFATLGPDTFKELKAAWAQVDNLVHVNAFPDMHDIGDALLKGKLADPVMDMEFITVTYTKVEKLLRELKALGVNNRNAGRSRKVTTPAALKAMYAAYDTFKLESGRLPATYEVVYGHAWGSHLPQQETTAPGVVKVSLDQIARL